MTVPCTRCATVHYVYLHAPRCCFSFSAESVLPLLFCFPRTEFFLATELVCLALLVLTALLFRAELPTHAQRFFLTESFHFWRRSHQGAP